MKPKYTDEDVQRLVEFSVTALPNIQGANPGWLDGFRIALKPFQPNPEEELINAMVDAYTSSNDFHYNLDLTTNRMRKALAVVKERGLPE